MDGLGAVEPEVVGELVEEFVWLANGILMDFEELFGEGTLAALDTAVDAWAARIDPAVGDVLDAEIGVEFALKLRPIVGLHLLDRQGMPSPQLF